MSSGYTKISVSENVRFMPQKLQYLEVNCSFPLYENDERNIISKEFHAVFGGCCFDYCVINGTDRGIR